MAACLLSSRHTTVFFQAGTRLEFKCMNPAAPPNETNSSVIEIDFMNKRDRLVKKNIVRVCCGKHYNDGECGRYILSERNR